ncbi:MAG: hypothetical protein HY052_02250 [Proteobacteria bacterium]|nr:hypothetical protein [Pseudomonadota bacterium]
MNKYILLAVLALAFTAPSFAHAMGDAKDGKKHHKMKKEHKEHKEHKAAGKKHHGMKKEKTEAAPAAAPAATDVNK